MKPFPVLITLEGADAPIVRQVPPDRKVSDLRDEIAPDTHAYLPDADAPLADDISLAEAGLDAGGEITLARTKKITIAVFYGGDECTEDWNPNQRLRLVLKWAIKQFAIPKPEQAEFELAFDSTEETVDTDTTVASLVGPDGAVAALDLRRIKAPQGHR